MSDPASTHVRDRTARCVGKLKGVSVDHSRESGYPAFLTTWRGEVRERAVTTRRKPSAPATRLLDFSRNTAFFPGARRKPSRIPRFSRLTSHESRLFPAFPRPSSLPCSSHSKPHQPVFTNHYPLTFDTKHESRPFFVCFDRRVLRNAGWVTSESGGRPIDRGNGLPRLSSLYPGWPCTCSPIQPMSKR